MRKLILSLSALALLAILCIGLNRSPKAQAGESAGMLTEAFDLAGGTVKLNNGVLMPLLGIGTFTLSNEQAADSVCWALEAGYRLIDTASFYANLDGVAEGIRRSGVPREDLFITGKLWPTEYTMDGIDETLRRLGLETIDLLLLHQPMGDYIAGYRALEEAVRRGKVRAIGLSHCSAEQFDEIAAIASIPPAVLQNEAHPYFQQTAMAERLLPYATVLEAWFPLGGRVATPMLLADETIAAIAQAHGKSPAQVILRWHLQSGHVAIPGSSDPDHIRENIEIFDFALTDGEMAQIAALDRNESYFTASDDNAQAEEILQGLGLSAN